MNKWRFLLLTSLCLSVQQADAQELCKSMCASEKQACRVKAEKDIQLELDPPIRSYSEHYPSKNPNQLPKTNSDNIAEFKNQRYQKSRMQGYKLCDDQASQCLTQCMNPSPSADPLSGRPDAAQKK